MLSIHGINLAITDVANRARANKLRVDDFGGGTFTVDNTGYLGTNLVMPILNVPEVGIVTMEAITKRPVVVSTLDGDVIAIRPVMNMVLAVDHRANDGAGGAALLRDIKAWLEAVGTETSIYRLDRSSEPAGRCRARVRDRRRRVHRPIGSPSAPGPWRRGRRRGPRPAAPPTSRSWAVRSAPATWPPPRH